jgi:hypothetical protein
MRISSAMAVLLVMLGYGIARQNSSPGDPCIKQSQLARYDGAPWSLKGAGVVCCPCRVPCPCRHNGPPSYGHCESTLYLHIKQGSYGATDLAGLRLVESGGACSMTYHKLSALYFDDKSSREKRAAMLKLIASMFSGQAAEFSYVRAIPIDAAELGNHIFRISIPGLLCMEVDRNWGQESPPFYWVAAVDHFSNALQYAQNIRYEIHDRAADIDFNYSHRQANYRDVDLTDQDYAKKRMLIQYLDGSGQFNEAQFKLIRELRLTPPDDRKLSELARTLRNK